MGTCTVVNCVKDYFFENEVYILGNIIFKPINTDLQSDSEEYNEQEKALLKTCEGSLKETEASRVQIANEFKNMLEKTGACVLCQPTLERSLITYIIYLITQIKICANERNVEFDTKDFSISSLIGFKKEAPFVEINTTEMDKLKNKYGFDFDKSNELKNGKNSIEGFLKSVLNIKVIAEKQKDTLTGLIKECSFKVTKKIASASNGVSFIYNLISEIYSGLTKTENQLTKPRKLETFFSIATLAAQKKIKDPKEIAFFYSEGDNCGKVENWPENMTYEERKPVKY